MSASDPTGLPEEGYADASPAKVPWSRRAVKASRSHWVLSSFAVVLVLLLAGAVYVWSQVHSVLSVSNVAVSYTVPDAPHLVAGNGETVYRIDPDPFVDDLRRRREPHRPDRAPRHRLDQRHRR